MHIFYATRLSFTVYGSRHCWRRSFPSCMHVARRHHFSHSPVIFGLSFFDRRWGVPHEQLALPRIYTADHRGIIVKISRRHRPWLLTLRAG
jgi:hypothetical protein